MKTAHAAQREHGQPLLTRASSINRALDQVGDKWCLLIIQEVFWGINSFNEMLAATGVSKGVLSNRLSWLQSIDCLNKEVDPLAGKRARYHLTRKSVDLYDTALMAIAWERQFYQTPALDRVALTHRVCGQVLQPVLCCSHCHEQVQLESVSYKPGPGACQDVRDKKVRRRSSISVLDVPSNRSLYKNLINLVGDRWTANVIALALHGLQRFDEFHKELPVATNILTDRLKFLVEQDIFVTTPYQQAPLRCLYRLSAKGRALYPWFLALLQWGDKWCAPAGTGKPMRLTHLSCGGALKGKVMCSACRTPLKPQQVSFQVPSVPPV